MPLYHWLILTLWLFLVAYWAILSLSAKRSLGGRSWQHGGALRVAIAVLLVLALQFPFVKQALGHSWVFTAGPDVLLHGAGIVLCACGVAVAIWARTYLGRNWGLPMSRKEHPELITGGPYAWVRHPIYTGILLALLGSAIGDSAFWFLPLVLFAPYFVYSARREEEHLSAQFPDQYAAYRERTCMLLPFLL